jgi:hypothetical protein
VGSRWRRSYGPDTSACFALATFSSSSPADLVRTKGLGLPFLTPLPISRGNQQSSNLRIRADMSAWILNHPSGREHYECSARSRSRIDCNARSGRAAAAGGDASSRPVVRTGTRPAGSSPTPRYLERRRGGTDPLARHRVDVRGARVIRTRFRTRPRGWDDRSGRNPCGTNVPVCRSRAHGPHAIADDRRRYRCRAGSSPTKDIV